MKEYNGFRGNNTKEHWNQKHTVQYEVNKEYDYSRENESNSLAYIKVANDLIMQNLDVFKNKSILDVGCAVGKAVNYYKMNMPDVEVTGYDFSAAAIEAAKIKVPNCNFEQRDFFEQPIDKDFGAITILETIEHIQEGTNYEILDNILEHCEYCVLSTVDTEDDCFGEHISHYKLDTFEKNGYDVIWKSNLSEINMPDGIYHYIIFLIKGKL